MVPNCPQKPQSLLGTETGGGGGGGVWERTNERTNERFIELGRLPMSNREVGVGGHFCVHKQS